VFCIILFPGLDLSSSSDEETKVIDPAAKRIGTSPAKLGAAFKPSSQIKRAKEAAHETRERTRAELTKQSAELPNKKAPPFESVS
jgi:hypothetical protein